MAKKKSKQKAKNPKGASKRKDVRFPALDPKYNLKNRFEEIQDIASYAKGLPDEAKDWLNSFTEEYVNANFTHKGQKIITDPAAKRESYSRNNARNRDVFTKSRIQEKMLSIGDVLTDEDELSSRLADLFQRFEESE